MSGLAVWEGGRQGGREARAHRAGGWATQPRAPAPLAAVVSCIFCGAIYLGSCKRQLSSRTPAPLTRLHRLPALCPALLQDRAAVHHRGAAALQRYCRADTAADHCESSCCTVLCNALLLGGPAGRLCCTSSARLHCVRRPQTLLPAPTASPLCRHHHPCGQVSYCILGGIGICSIIVFWMVSLHRTRERKRRLKRAKRAFTSRWHSVTSSMGLAVAAAAAVGEQRGQGNCSTGGGSGGGAGGVSVTRRRATTQTEERRVSWLHTGAAAIAVPPVATLPPSPFQAAQQPAAADTAGRGPSAPTAEGKPPNSRGSQQLALLSGGQPTSSQGRPQLLQSAGTMEGPQVGGANADLALSWCMSRRLQRCWRVCVHRVLGVKHLYFTVPNPPTF